MGSNKASLDYYDYETGIYHVNIYAERNPGVVYELGDVGNDIQIYGNKLYAVIELQQPGGGDGCRHRPARSHRLHTQLPLHRLSGRLCLCKLLCRPGQDRPTARLGYVAKVDTATMQIVDTCTVGYQPEEMVIRGQQTLRGQLRRLPGSQLRPDGFGHRPDDLHRNKKDRRGHQRHRLELDRYGNIYVSSRGDYYDTPTKTYVIDSRTDEVTDILHLLPNSNMTLAGDSLYVYSTEWSWYTEPSSPPRTR